MNIEIEGVGFRNKGAELMLRAIVDRVRGWGEMRIAVRSSRGTEAQRSELDLYRRADFARFGALAAPIRRALPTSVRRHMRVMIPEEVDAILDASGFRYSDRWGKETSKVLDGRTRAARRLGAKYVLMPQAFGPFQDPVGRQAFQRACENIELIFARDQDSFDHVRELIGDDTRLHLAPDFTPGLPPVWPDVTPMWRGDHRGVVAVVPNARMLDKTSVDVARRYVEFLTAVIRDVHEHAYAPVIILHSNDDGDLQLGNEIAAASRLPVLVVSEPNAQVLKGLIARCDLMVGSRFHGLMNALSQGVPAVGTSWSHKYQRLFESYDSTDLLVDLDADLSSALAMVGRLLDDRERETIRQRLEQANLRLGHQIEDMWRKVYHCLLGAHRADA